MSTWAESKTTTSNTQAADTNHAYTEQNWGIAIGLRYAEIPYKTASGDRSVVDAVPLLFFDDKHFYIRGLEGGVKLINTEQFKLNALLRYRWFDIPADMQNQVKGDAWDGGVQLRNRMGNWDLRSEFMTDGDARFYADIGFDTSLGDKYATLYPYIGLRIKSAKFNTKYYGFEQEHVEGGIDLLASIEGRYHLVSNLYLIGRLGGTILDGNARKSSFVQKGSTWEAYAGVAFFNNPDTPLNHTLDNNAYVRIAHGEVTPSSLGEVLSGHKVDDIYHNQLTSLFYGYPLTNELFGLPLDIYLTPGLVYHHHSEVQESFYEYVIAVKAYYTIKWPVRWRLGLAEGLSYSSQINYVERTELQAKGYRPSKVLNYLDLSVDINIGDIFHVNSLRNTWLGYGIHHRSGMFEAGSEFGRIKGGSNYTTIYLQQHF
ncbi:MAG: MipA/OmpV family protein [Gammaproteobacteria bacterium]|jgi:MipA family protein